MQAFPTSPLELHVAHASQAVQLDEVHDNTRVAVEIERRSNREALSYDGICTNSDMMVKYIEFMTDRQLAVLPPQIFTELFHADMYMFQKVVGQAVLLGFPCVLVCWCVSSGTTCCQLTFAHTRS